VTGRRRCGNCRHREAGRQTLEREIPGLSSFGSAFGSSLGDSRLCLRHDRLTSVDDACDQFAAIAAR
jgi:hypothetical protein